MVESMVARQDREVESGATSGESGAWLDRILPIIRVRKARPWTIFPMRHEVVGLYRDELVVVRKPISIPLPESVYEPGGAVSLKALGTRGGRVVSSSLDSVVNLTSLRGSMLRETDGLKTYNDQGSFRFRVRGDDTPNLYRAMEHLLGDRYRHRDRPQALGQLVRLAPFFALLAATVYLGLDSAYIVPILILTFAALVIGIADLTPGPRRLHGQLKAKPTKDLSGREPLRLRATGMMLSSLGTLFPLVFYGGTLFGLLSQFRSRLASMAWYFELPLLVFLAGIMFVIPSFFFGSYSTPFIWLTTIGLAFGIGIGVLGILGNPGPDTVLSLLSMVSPYLGLLLIHAGRRLVARNARTTLEGDQRPPILYLRSFEDDADDDLAPNTFLARLFGVTIPTTVARLPLWRRVIFEAHPLRLLRSLFGRITVTTELQIASFFRELGPFIAIGKPGERLATIGADRVYVENEQWQQTVLDFMERSRYVVLQASVTEGFLWEVRNVLERAAPEKILFCLSNFRAQQNDYEDFRLKAEEVVGWRFPRGTGNLEEPHFLFFEAERRPVIRAMSYRSPLLWPVLGEVTDLRHTLSDFVERAPGGASDHLPKTYPGHGLLAFVLFLTLYPIMWGALLYAVLSIFNVLLPLAKVA